MSTNPAPEGTSPVRAGSGPILACHDGTEGTADALRAIGPILAHRDVVVLTVWQTFASRMARAGSFGPTGIVDAGPVDTEEESAAQAVAEEGARLATEAGYAATARIARAETGATWPTIVAIADELDASLIICGTHGRNPAEHLFIGGTSAGVLHHAKRPVLLSPIPHD